MSVSAHCWLWGRLLPGGLCWCVLAFGEGTVTRRCGDRESGDALDFAVSVLVEPKTEETEATIMRWPRGDVGSGGLAGLEAPVQEGGRPRTCNFCETSALATCLSLVVLGGLGGAGSLEVQCTSSFYPPGSVCKRVYGGAPRGPGPASSVQGQPTHQDAR